MILFSQIRLDGQKPSRDDGRNGVCQTLIPFRRAAGSRREHGIFLLFLFLLTIGLETPLWARAAARITAIKGVVHIRRGLEETWQPAAVGQVLDEMDSIITGEAAETILKMEDDRIFRLGSNAIIDLTDLRHITQQELFLLLMTEKIGNLENHREKSRLQLGHVTVIHGENRNPSAPAGQEARGWLKEYNGAGALHNQSFFPNAILKLAKIINRFPQADDCGQMYFLLGKSFMAMQQNGQALGALRSSIEKLDQAGCTDENAGERRAAAESAISTLRKLE